MQRIPTEFNGKLAYACFDHNHGAHLRDPITNEIIASWSDIAKKYVASAKITTIQESKEPESNVQKDQDDTDSDDSADKLSFMDRFSKKY